MRAVGEVVRMVEENPKIPHEVTGATSKVTEMVEADCDIFLTANQAPIGSTRFHARLAIATMKM